MTTASELFTLYGGLERARGRNSVSPELDAKGKRKSKNQTLHEPYTVKCWENHLAGRDGLGVVPITDNAVCNWGAIDIDEYPLDLIDLENKLKTKNLPFVVLRTKSGGAHLTCYFEEWQQCSEVRSKMAEVSFAIGLGNREFYPKQSRLANSQDVGNWLNMPYFKADDTERYAIKDGQQLTVEEFIVHAKATRVNSLSDIYVDQQDSPIDDGPPCLQRIVSEKAGPGERNNVLFNIGVYCRLKFESEWEQELEKANISFIDPPLSHKEVGAVIKSLEKKAYVFTCNNSPLCNNCNREICKTREFGIASFQHVDIGIVLDSVTKLNSDPPIWIVSLDGIRTEIETDDLLDQNRFRKVCTNTINKLPGRMKGEEWDKFVRSKLSSIEQIEAPIETKPREQAFQVVYEFLMATPQGVEPSETRWAKNGSGVVLNGNRYLDFLSKRNIMVDKRKLWIILMQAGVVIQNDGFWHVPYSVIQGDIESKEPKASPLKKKDDSISF